MVSVKELAFRTAAPATELESKPEEDVEYARDLGNRPPPSSVVTAKGLATDKHVFVNQPTAFVCQYRIIQLALSWCGTYLL